MLKLHLLGYHKLYGNITSAGHFNPHFGFHCRTCRRSWYPQGRKLLEEEGRRPRVFFNGLDFLGSMTVPQLLQAVKDADDRAHTEAQEFRKRQRELDEEAGV